MLVYEPLTCMMFTTDEKLLNEKLERISEKLSCDLRAIGHISLADYLKEISKAFGLDLYPGLQTYEVGIMGSEMVLKAGEEVEGEPVILEIIVDGNSVP